MTGVPTRVARHPWRRGPWRRLARLGWLLAVLGTAVWGLGFAWFAWQSARKPADVVDADGIVVLTGGADRIEAGLRLLADGRAPILLISGVGRVKDRGPDLAELAQLAGLDPEPLAPHVTLGRVATTTLGNATETADWVAAHGVRTLIVVTAGYHMPRALLELRRTMPDTVFLPYPVRPAALRREGRGAPLLLLVTEYNKLLGAELGLARLRRDAS